VQKKRASRKLAPTSPPPTKGWTMNTISDVKARHIQQLVEESSIAREVIAERGVHTVAGGRELPKGFSWRQKKRGAGILFTVHRPNGETSWSFRPDEPDPENTGRKYEQPSKHYGGPGNILDVHPRMRHLIDATSAEISFVEGIKKADALTSRGVLAVAITGVWNWLSDGQPIADMLEIPLDGRRVNICFDSDMLHNPNVQDAARRLAEHLIGRGAEVFIAYLPDKPDGSKMGADDFFVAGGTLSEFRMLMRRYDPADFTIVRLSRDERLQLALENLERKFWSFEWKGMGGHSARDVALKLIEAARRHGKVVDDGIRVQKAQGPLAIEAKVSARTLWKALNRLEEWGFLYRDNEDRKPDKTGAFVLRASVSHYRQSRARPETTTLQEDYLHKGDLHLRAPRLRWSRPKFTPRRGVVEGTRRVRQGVKLESRDRIVRLSKVRGAILDVLDAAGGSATLQEIAEALHRKRPRDIRRRNLPMLEESGILAVEDDVVTLADNWLEALEVQRELGKEAEADELAAVRHRLKSSAFHSRHQRPADEVLGEDEMRRRRESYPERRRQYIVEAMTRLFAERPEYRTRRPGQVTCALVGYLDPDFPRGLDGYPKDAEVEEILNGAAA
jgi:uncharacterized protein DUF3854